MPVREAGKAAEKKTAYEDVRKNPKYAGLPKWTKQEEGLAALKGWEVAHQDQCTRQRDDGRFFGFTEVGQGYLGRYTRFISVPAVRDAAEDAAEGKGSPITEIMDLVVRKVLTSREDVARLKEDTQKKYEEIMDPAKLTELTTLEAQLTGTLKTYVPDASVSLSWLKAGGIEIPMPRADVKLVEDGYRSAVIRTGHGLQRAFILTMLQHLAVAQVPREGTTGGKGTVPEEEHDESLKESRMPNLILGIEEPELYQHPNRQRHLAKILLNLATGIIPGVARKTLVKKEFDRGADLPLVQFPEDGTAVQDTPKLTLVVLGPESEWEGNGTLRSAIAEWTKQRGKSPRLYPGSLVWCVRKPGRDLKDKVEAWLAWKRVEKEVADGTLEGDFDRSDRTEIIAKVRDAEEIAKDEVWAGYRFVVLADNREPDGLKVIDLGAGHATPSESLCGRVVTALKSQALLNDSPGAGYLERRWPPAFKDTGAWPLASLRQAFLNGSMERLLDPDKYLKGKVPEFVTRGEFGLASGQQPGGVYARIWFEEMLPSDEVAFDADVYLLTKAKAKALKAKPAPLTEGGGEEKSEPVKPIPSVLIESLPGKKTVHISGTIPLEVWNKLGTRLLPKLKAGSSLRLGLDFSVDLDSDAAAALQVELRQVLQDLNLTGQIRIEMKE